MVEKLSGLRQRAAMELVERAAASGNPELLDRAIAELGAVVDGLDVADPHYGAFVSTLSGMLATRFDRTRQVGDLERAVQLGEAAFENSGPGDGHFGVVLANYTSILVVQAKHSGEQADVERAFRVSADAMTAIPADHPFRPAVLVNLSRALGFVGDLCAELMRRFELGGDVADLDEAIRLQREAVRVTPTDHSALLIVLSNLGIALRVRFEETGNASDLRDAVAIGRDAVERTPTPHPQLPSRLTNLAVALNVLFQATGRLSDLDEAIAVGREAVAHCAPDDPDRAGYLANVGGALIVRYQQTGRQADLDEAIAVAREAVSTAGTDDPRYAVHLGNLVAVLEVSCRETGRTEGLDEAITQARKAVATDLNLADRAQLEFTLGTALAGRFRRMGRRSDLDAAIAAGQEAVRLTPASHLRRATYLTGLGLTLRDSFRMSGEIKDLDDAIAAKRAAADLTPSGSPFRCLYLGNLGIALHLRFEQTENPSDLNEAISVCTTALRECSAENPYRATLLITLGRTLRARFRVAGQLADLDAAISAGRAALAVTPVDHPDRCEMLTSLSQSMYESFTRKIQIADAGAAVELLRQAVGTKSAPVRDRLDAACAMGKVAASLGSGWEEAAVEGYAAAVELLDRLAWRGLNRADQQQLLARYPLLASDAAACAIAAGRPEQAVMLLEQGRAVIWTQLTQHRDRDSDLALIAPDLAKRLSEIAQALERPTEPDARLAEQRMTLAREWDELVAQIRQRDGFEHFLAPPPLEQLIAAASDGPVVIVNLSKWGCAALIVSNDQDTPVTVCDLPALTPKGAIAQIAAYLDSGTTEATLAWLWDSITAPVLTRLRYTSTPRPGIPWPRIWWYPTGILSLLPLHAAGHHGKPPWDNALDRVISSYTPTLRALVRARDAEPAAPSRSRMLHVALTTTPGRPDLPFVGAERALIAQLFQRTLLEDDEATKDGVARELKEHAWIHLSCHGYFEMADPLQSGLSVHDGTLTIADLVTAAEDGGDFAFLSACRTAFSTATGFDEAITVMSALQYAGYRHVIGTLWIVQDLSAAQITVDTYAELMADKGFRPEHAAAALHQAVRNLRDTQPDQPRIWAPFIHAGP